MRRQAWIDRTDTELGSSTRAGRAVDPRLRRAVPRDLYGLDLRRPGFGSWLEPPRPTVTLMIDLAGSITDGGAALPDAWIGGLDERPSVVGLGGGDYAAIDIELTPIGGHTVLGRPLAALEGACVPLTDAFGAAGRELAGRLREAPTWDARFDVVERFLLSRLVDGPAPTPPVIRADQRLRETHGRVRIAELARELGCSRRYLTSRFTAELGLSPKVVARQLRFGWVREQLAQGPERLAEVAVRAGYFDQAHLNRDFRELAGVTPTQFVSRLMTGGGVLGDGL